MDNKRIISVEIMSSNSLLLYDQFGYIGYIEVSHSTIHSYDSKYNHIDEHKLCKEDIYNDNMISLEIEKAIGSILRKENATWPNISPSIEILKRKEETFLELIKQNKNAIDKKFCISKERTVSV